MQCRRQAPRPMRVKNRLTSSSHILAVDGIEDKSWRLIDVRLLGVIIVDTALFSGEGTPLIVIARDRRLPNLTKVYIV